MNRTLAALSWPETKLADAISALATHAGIMNEGSNATVRLTGPPGESILWYAQTHGFEAEPVVTSLRLLDGELSQSCPALLRLPSGEFLALARSKRAAIELQTPAGKREKVPLREIVSAITDSVLAPLRTEFASLFGHGELPIESIDFLLADSLDNKRFDQLWRLRLPAEAPARRWLKHMGVPRNALALLSAHAGHYLVWILSWLLIGQLTFSGQLDRGWILGWTLLLVTLIPLRLLTTWKQGVLAIGLGGVLKARLLKGVLRLQPDEIRSSGIGHFLAQAFEAETVERLALSGAVDGLLAIVEIGIAAILLGWMGTVLLISTAIGCGIAIQFDRRHSSWSDLRFRITYDLVEAMTGHRTRLVQQTHEQLHESEDSALATYAESSRKLDATGTMLTTLTPRVWLLTGLGCLFPSLVHGGESMGVVGTALGGILLGYSALGRIASTASELPALRNAWKQIAPLFRAASRVVNSGSVPEVPRQGNAPLVAADELTFRYTRDSAQVLKACTLSIERGDRILLEGPSGGGKSTLAALITGAREPNSGLLLLRGLDKATIGDESWRRRLASAPQFHDNHILTGTLAFNLLMGRSWPPSAADMEEAQKLCRELGLGSLIENMPAGLLQMVGEGGWQLSHGERSRIFLARALLQGADLVVLDESFAALDPENLSAAMECTLERTETLVVIAHP